MKIPLTKPYWNQKEEKAVICALRKTNGTGDRENTRKLIIQLKKLTGARYIFPTTSCTHGLELAMLSLDLKKGDEVIVPSFTMTSTANCVLIAGATPIFADVDPATCMLSVDDVSQKITSRTKAIIVVHYAGMAASMENLQSLAKKHNLYVIEDAAHAIGALYKGKPLGTCSDIGVYSFHGTKNVSCGEGGAVVTNNKELADKMDLYRANGTNRHAFLAGIVDKYSWMGKGSSYFLSDILAAILVEQLKKLKTINKRRKEIADYYNKKLINWTNLIDLPIVTEGTTPNWHIYAVLFKNPQHRDIFIKKMRAKGIEVSYHYVPLHSSTMGKKLQAEGIKGFSSNHLLLPHTERVFQSLVRLPIYPDLTNKQQKYVLTSVQSVLKQFA